MTESLEFQVPKVLLSSGVVPRPKFNITMTHPCCSKRQMRVLRERMSFMLRQEDQP